MSVTSKPPESPKIFGQGDLLRLFPAGLGDGIVAALTHTSGNIDTVLEGDGIRVRVHLNLSTLFWS